MSVCISLIPTRFNYNLKINIKHFALNDLLNSKYYCLAFYEYKTTATAPKFYVNILSIITEK